MCRLYWYLCMGLFFNTLLWSQSITGNLEGFVFTEGNMPLKGVEVVVNRSELQEIRGTTTDESGYFRIVALPAGMYEAEFYHVAFHKLTIQNVQLSLGKTTSLGRLALQSRSYELSDITITKEHPTIDATSTTTGLNINHKVFEILPVDRNYRSMTTLVPTANQSFYGDDVNISGSSGLENVYYVDGVNTTQPSTLSLSTNLPYNFIQEIEVKTGGYEAEYGSATGGVINVITQSGTNQFSGSVYGFYTNNDFVSQRRIGDIGSNVKGFANYDIGINFHGPILKDRLWYFIAYNPTVETEDIRVPGFGLYQDKTISHLLSGKLTWRASSKTQINFSVFGDPLRRDRIRDISESILNPDVFLVRDELGGLNYSLNASSLVSTTTLIEANIAHVQTNKVSFGATETARSEPVLIDLENNLRSGGLGLSNDEKAQRSSVSFKTTLFLKQHTMKAGFDFENNVNRQQFLTMGHGEDGPHTIGGMGIILRFGPDSYIARGIRADHKVANRIPAIFVQDAWQVSPNFLVRAGIRISKQFLVGRDGKVAQSIETEYQPRIGFVWQTGVIGSQKIHGSFGRFYQKLGTGVSDFLHSDPWEIVIRYEQNPLEHPTSGDTVYARSLGITEEVDGLEGQYIDEYTLGYERLIGQQFKVGIKGIYRFLGQVVEDFWDSENNRWILGNPGKGRASYFPELTREYRALNIYFQKLAYSGINVFIGYTLSRNYGNYSGVFNHDSGSSLPNLTSSGDSEELIPNSTGLLPNDRTHVLKLWGTYRFKFGLDAGSTFLWQSGTPLSNRGATSNGYLQYFLQQRGTAGRTPSIWDWSIRLSYHLHRVTSVNATLILDLLHIGNPGKAVEYDQVHFYAQDENGNQIFENPDYLTPIRYQPPFTLRFGVEAGF